MLISKHQDSPHACCVEENTLCLWREEEEERLGDPIRLWVPRASRFSSRKLPSSLRFFYFMDRFIETTTLQPSV